MSLTVFNGSPRGKKSNSNVVIKWFTDGYAPDSVNETYYLNKVRHHDEYVDAFTKGDKLLMVFPLYVDGMPGQVKKFIEALEPYKNQCSSKSIVYIIHSGFGEAIQSYALRDYLNNLSKKLGMKASTVIILPGSEGFRMMPDSMTRKQSSKIAKIANQFKMDIPLDQNIIMSLQKRVRMSKFALFIFKIINRTGITNMYWNQNLKENSAYEKRFDAPYADAPVPATTKAYLSNIK